MNTSTNKQEIIDRRAIKTYQDFVDRFEINPILNQNILEDHNFELISGETDYYYNENDDLIDYVEYENDENAYSCIKEIMQTFVISESDAEKIMNNTSELIWYNPKNDTYVWALDFYGNKWCNQKIETLY